MLLNSIFDARPENPAGSPENFNAIFQVVVSASMTLTRAAKKDILI